MQRSLRKGRAQIVGVSDDVRASLRKLMFDAWDERSSDEFPNTADVKLSNGSVRVDACYLYADLAGSTLLQKNYKDTFAARVIRCYLNGASQIIRANDGQIKSFDGDRVMGVFVGNSRRNNAANAALKINWLVAKCLNPLVKERLTASGSTLWVIKHGVGIDAGEALVARAGVRNSAGETTHNDLVSVGRAPNVAAKLSSVRNLGKGALLMTDDVYRFLNNDQKLSKPAGERMWSGPHGVDVGPYHLDVYASSWHREP